MAMAEKQSAHRESLEADVIHAGVAKETRGSWFAFIITLVIVGIGFVLIEQGRDVQGLVAIVGSVTVLAGVFVYSKHEQKKERAEKADALQTRKMR